MHWHKLMMYCQVKHEMNQKLYLCRFVIQRMILVIALVMHHHMEDPNREVEIVVINAGHDVISSNQFVYPNTR